MEESHQRSRTFMAGCRAPLRDLQTASSPHHTDPSVVSYYSFVKLEYFINCKYEGKYVFPHHLLSTKQTPSRLSCAATMSHQVLHGLRTKRPWGARAGRMTEGNPWMRAVRSLGLGERGRVFTTRWPVRMRLHPDLSGFPTASSSARCAGWSALDLTCWWCTSVATQVRTSQHTHYSIIILTWITIHL